MSFPDVATLALCSILASTAFGFVFTVLWLRNRSAWHFAYWAASSLIYGLTLLTLGLMPSGSLVLVTMLYALLGLSNVLPAAGVMALEGKPVLRAWMVGPLLAAATGHALPALLSMWGWIQPQRVWQTVGDAGGLSIALGLPGAILAFGSGAAASAGRRMAGIAMLGYLPAYMLSIAGEFMVLPGTQLVALMGTLSDQVLLGVLNLGLLAVPAERVQRQLREIALKDALTGCWNRAGLATLTPACFITGLSVLALDVDHFKLINDRHGHAAGDEVLGFIGAEARTLAIGFGAQVVRQGGDEFIVLLPANLIEPGHFATLLKNRLGTRIMRGGAWSVSIGIATVRAEDRTLDEAIARADVALYRAKASRRPPPMHAGAANAPLLTLAG